MDTMAFRQLPLVAKIAVGDVFYKLGGPWRGSLATVMDRGSTCPTIGQRTLACGTSRLL
jgi:hypothetical protein